MEKEQMVVRVVHGAVEEGEDILLTAEMEVMEEVVEGVDIVVEMAAMAIMQAVAVEDMEKEEMAQAELMQWMGKWVVEEEAVEMVLVEMAVTEYVLYSIMY